MLKITEAQWQQTVLDTAAGYGWQWRYHTWDSRRSTQGFPDLVLVRAPGLKPGAGELVMVELKTDTGKLTRDQADWLDALRCAGVEAHVWRPADWPAVQARLAQRRPHG